jgi:hypothetical protein
VGGRMAGAGTSIARSLRRRLHARPRSAGQARADLFLLAAARLGVPPAQCLVFEDSPTAIRAARAAGMRCVAIPNPLTAPPAPRRGGPRRRVPASPFRWRRSSCRLGLRRSVSGVGCRQAPSDTRARGRPPACPC